MATLFSIVIPTLNEELFLPDLLKCLCEQTFTDFEVILVDGSSKDNTVKLARSFRKLLPVMVIRIVKKRNVGYQRNVGARHAHGKYIVFFDADVRIRSNFLATVAKKIATSKARLLTTYVASPDLDPKKIAITSAVNIGKEIVTLIGKPTSGGYNIIVEKKFFEKMKGFDVTVLHGEDYEFVQRCHDHGVFLHIIRNPAMIFPFRRFETHGYLSVLELEATAALYALMNKSFLQQQSEYPMGGHLYKKPKQ